MSFDVYGQPLASGCCEVHPHVHEPWPCSLCIVQDGQRQAERAAYDEVQREAEREYYAELQAEHELELFEAGAGHA